MGFYMLDNPRAWDLFADANDMDPVITGAAPQCSHCGEPVGMLEWLPPHRIELTVPKGGRFGDFLHTVGDGFIASERVKLACEQGGLSGVTKWGPPVVIVRVIGSAARNLTVPTYYHAQVARPATWLDEKASGLVRKGMSCPVCRLGDIKFERIVVDENTYRGHDLFYARGLPGRILVSERFVKLCEDNGFTNAKFVPCEELHKEEFNLP